MMNKVNEKAIRPWSPGNYRIIVDGDLPENWLDMFTAMRVTNQKREDQTTVTSLTGQFKDQSHLLGLLNALAELNLPILFVDRIS